jgi:hypothetical protein
MPCRNVDTRSGPWARVYTLYNFVESGFYFRFCSCPYFCSLVQDCLDPFFLSRLLHLSSSFFLFSFICFFILSFLRQPHLFVMAPSLY